jgi:hypothetical protein
MRIDHATGTDRHGLAALLAVFALLVQAQAVTPERAGP